MLVFDKEPREQRLIEHPSHRRRGIAIRPPAVVQQVERVAQLAAHGFVVAIQSFQPTVELSPRSAQALLLGGEKVQRDSIGVVSLQQFRLLGLHLLQARLQSRSLAALSSFEALELAQDAPLDLMTQLVLRTIGRVAERAE